MRLIRLVLLNLLVAFKSLWEYLKVIFFFYSNRAFRRADVRLLCQYLFKNPYHLHRDFLKAQQAEEIYCYGETYLTTFAKAIKAAAPTSDDLFVELGSARGRNCFWVKSFVGCKVLGLEQVPAFVERAQKVVERLSLEKIEFRCEDFFKSDLSDATLLFVDATFIEGRELGSLLRKLDTMAAGARVVGVNLTLVAESAPPSSKRVWERIDKLALPFLWGEGEVAVFRKLHD